MSRTRCTQPPAARSKYRSVRTEYAGVLFDSKAEARRAAELDLLVKAGHVRFWIGQPKFRLGCPENVYRPDFLVVAGNGSVYVEDVKGVDTPKFRRDLKLWRAYGPCPLHVVRAKDTEVVMGRGEPASEV